MAHHIFQLETELQNNAEAALKASPSFSVSEKLERYGSSALSGVSRASFKELRQFLPKGKAEAVMAALSISNVADNEHALSAPLTNAEAIYRANLDMKGFHQEVVRVVLLRAPKSRGSSRFALSLLRLWLRPEFWIPTAE